MTSKEKIKAEVENRIKEHKKQLRRKDLTVVSEAAMKGSLGAYESLLNFIINMPACETRKVEQHILVNMAHVTNINEYVQQLDPANADDIRRALTLAHDDRARAARLLGISERTLYRKIKEHGIEGKETAQ